MEEGRGEDDREILSEWAINGGKICSKQGAN